MLRPGGVYHVYVFPNSLFIVSFSMGTMQVLVAIPLWCGRSTFPLSLQPWKFYITAWCPVVLGSFTSVRGDVTLSR